MKLFLDGASSLKESAMKKFVVMLIVCIGILVGGCVASKDSRFGQGREQQVVQNGQQMYKGKMDDGGHYEGWILNDVPHGFGTYIWTSGKKYVGQFVDGKYAGQGVLTFANRLKYVGQFVDGKPHGRGENHMLNGVFVGEFRNAGCYKGVFTGKDGIVIIGVFMGGKKSGTIAYPDGREYEGEWDGNAKFVGAVSMYDYWIHERPHGFGKMTYPDGTTKIGMWWKGKFKG